MRFAKLNIGDKSFLIDIETTAWVALDKSEVPNNIENAFRMLRDISETIINDLRLLRSTVLPQTFELHVSNACNLNCVYCYIPKELRRNPQNLMSIETAQNAINKLLDYIDNSSYKDIALLGNKLHVVFHGGEPLINKHVIYELLEMYKREQKIQWGLQTNALLLFKQDIREFKKYRVDIGISLDANKDDINNMVRKTYFKVNVLDHINKILDYAKEIDMPIGAIITLTKYNKHIDSIMVNPVNPSSDGAKSVMPNIDELLESYTKLIEYIKGVNSKSDKAVIIKNLESIVVALLTSNLRTIICDCSPCGASRLLLVITHDGTVYPCSDFVGKKEFILGDINKDSIDAIIDSKPARVLRDRTVDRIPACSKCPFKLICGANCVAGVYSLYGTLYEKSPYCSFKKKIIEQLLYYIATNGYENASKIFCGTNIRKMLNSFGEIISNIQYTD